MVLAQSGVQLQANSGVLPILVGPGRNLNDHFLAGLHGHGNGLTVFALGQDGAGNRVGQHNLKLLARHQLTCIGQLQHAVFFSGPGIVVAIGITGCQLCGEITQFQLLGVLLAAQGEYHLGSIAFSGFAAVANDHLGRHTAHGRRDGRGNDAFFRHIGLLANDHISVRVGNHQVRAARVIDIVVCLLTGFQRIGDNGELAKNINVFRLRLAFLLQGDGQLRSFGGKQEGIQGLHIARGDAVQHKHGILARFHGDGIFALLVGSAHIGACHQTHACHSLTVFIGHGDHIIHHNDLGQRHSNGVCITGQFVLGLLQGKAFRHTDSSGVRTGDLLGDHMAVSIGGQIQINLHFHRLQVLGVILSRLVGKLALHVHAHIFQGVARIVGDGDAVGSLGSLSLFIVLAVALLQQQLKAERAGRNGVVFIAVHANAELDLVALFHLDVHIQIAVFIGQAIVGGVAHGVRAQIVQIEAVLADAGAEAPDSQRAGFFRGIAAENAFFISGVAAHVKLAQG